MYSEVRKISGCSGRLSFCPRPSPLAFCPRLLDSQTPWRSSRPTAGRVSVPVTRWTSPRWSWRMPRRMVRVALRQEAPLVKMIDDDCIFNEDIMKIFWIFRIWHDEMGISWEGGCIQAHPGTWFWSFRVQKGKRLSHIPQGWKKLTETDCWFGKPRRIA